MSTRLSALHTSLLGGVETSLPAHLLTPTQLRTCHNFRFSPTLTQVPHKVIYGTTGLDDILHISVLPGSSPGQGLPLLFDRGGVYSLTGASIDTGLSYDASYRRWATTLYNGRLWYTNELNSIRSTDGASSGALANAPAARYLVEWFDHLVVGAPSGYPHRIAWSHLYDFTKWTPENTNEADYYDFVEWYLQDFPYQGVTGLARLGATLYVYTPTAIIPVAYTGRPHVIRVNDDGVVERCGNSYPWSLVPLTKVHFFYDAIEQNFFAFDGQVQAIGDPVRGFLQENLNTDPVYASRMYGYVDVANREIWWPFVGVGSTTFNKAVVFNYRMKTWSTASIENVHSCNGGVVNLLHTIAELTGTVAELTGTIATLGVGGSVPKLYGSTAGALLRDELPTDADASLVAQDDPVVETPDFTYGDIRTQKEVDSMYLDASATGSIEVRVAARDYLSDTINWSSDSTKLSPWQPWSRTLPEGRLTFNAKSGRILRYRFTAKGCRGLTFQSYEDSWYGHGAEK
jgi:hypothetical protein